MRRRQMRQQQQGMYGNGINHQPAMNGGFVQGLKNKVDNVLHGDRRYWKSLWSQY